tara:strand:- start:552 stop:845 length:294 start_codon:yes stop_codon:yes gene_type:complete
MKDKRTDTKLKEQGENMSHENDESVSLTLPYLIEKHKKEVWDWKQKESEWIRTDNLFKGSQKIIEELSAKLVDQVRVISELNYEITKLKKELADKNK